MTTFYTDYPFDFLGNTPGKIAPIREIELVSYDGNKYCDIIVNGVKTSIKCGYIYYRPGRSEEVPSISLEDLKQYER